MTPIAARLIILIKLLLISPSCQSTTSSFPSPSKDLRLLHVESGGSAPKYLLIDKKAGEIGTVESIIDKESVRNVKGLPNVQSVVWSESERTIVIHEDMSDASPDYHYKLLIKNESGNYDAYDFKPPIRGWSLNNIYGSSPNIGNITDSHIELLWTIEPKKELISIEEIISNQNS